MTVNQFTALEQRMADANKLKYVVTDSKEKTLDSTLDELDSLIGKLDSKNKTAAVQIFVLMDLIHTKYKDLIKFDKTGKPENQQINYIYKQIHKQASNLLSAVGGVSYLQKKRKETQISEDAWWWYLDDYLAKIRKKSFFNLVKGLGIFAIVLIILVFSYQRWLAPPPEVRERLRFENQASLAIEDGRYEDALIAVDEALRLGPDEYSLWIQKGMLLTKLGKENLAQESFNQARTLGIENDRYYIERIYNAMQVGLVDLAQDDINQLLLVNPESAEGYLFRGQIAESQGDNYAAIQAYTEASRLAEEQDKVELLTTIRMRLAMLMQSGFIPTAEN